MVRQVTGESHQARRIRPKWCLALWLLAWSGSGLWTQENHSARELQQLQGAWRAVAGERDGQLRPKSFLEALRVRVEGEVMVMEIGKRQQKLRISLDPSVRPRTIDLVHLEGKEKGEKWQGIYALENGQWRICVSPPGSPRPDDFFTRPGTGREFLLLERKK